MASQCSSEVKTFHQCLVCDELFEECSDLEIHNKTHIKQEQTDDVLQQDQQEIPNNICVKIEQTDDVPQPDICNSSMGDIKVEKNIDALTFTGRCRIEGTDKSKSVIENTSPTSSQTLLYEALTLNIGGNIKHSNKSHVETELDNDIPQHGQTEMYDSSGIDAQQTDDIPQQDVCNNSMVDIKANTVGCRIKDTDKSNSVTENTLPTISKSLLHDALTSNIGGRIRYANNSKTEDYFPMTNEPEDNLTAKLRPENNGPSCSKAFARESGLSVHTRTDTRKRTYYCGVCGKTFKFSSSISKHMNTHTGAGEKTYECVFCDKSFTDRSNLSKHIRMHRPYKCDICHKSFSVSGVLTRHMTIHTGEKLYPCDICHVAFSQAGYLKKHIRVHTREKPYKCDICLKAFSNGSYLSTHKRIHTGEKPYRCDVCHKTFSDSSSLSRHMRIHTGKKPYKCDVCQKAFSQSSSLTTHMKMHTGEKP